MIGVIGARAEAQHREAPEALFLQRVDKGDLIAPELLITFSATKAPKLLRMLNTVIDQKLVPEFIEDEGVHLARFMPKQPTDEFPRALVFELFEENWYLRN